MNRRPHVILEALQVRRRFAGTGRAIGDLFRALAVRDRGMKFTVLASDPEVFRDLDQWENWNIVECPGARGGNLKKVWFTQMRLPGLVRELEGDLLHCLQFLGPLNISCPLAVTVYDLAWMLFPETIEGPRHLYYRWLVPRTLARAGSILAVSEATARETARLFPDAAERVRVTPLGTPSWVLQMALDNPVRRDKKPDGGFFLFVGTLEPRKNLPRLLDAYDLFCSQALNEGVPNAEIPGLVFVGGKGWKDSHLRSRMSLLIDEGRLKVLDQCDDVTLWDLYGSALALVFPSLHEGFGLPILEAMTAGLPVLTSDRSGMKEVAGDGALLVDPEMVTEIAEGLRVMAFEPAIRLGLAAGGPEQSRRWSWERTADLTAGIYRELLADTRNK